MKKTLLSVLVAFVITPGIYSQCNPAIPGTANVVNTTQTVNGGFTPQWVCDGDTLFSGGGIFLVYLEPGSVMNTNGGIDSIYVKNGATLNMSGGIHEIFPEPSAVLNISGGSATINPCIAITFDYTNAPLNGCLITSALAEIENSFAVYLFPNPSSGIFTIESKKEISSIEIINLLGEKIYSAIQPFNHSTTIDLSKERKGIYFIRIISEKGTATKKLIIQ